MKKLLFISLIMFYFVMSFSTAFGEEIGLFEKFNGRSKTWIERNFPDYKIIPNYGEAYDGYYWIETLLCEDGGLITLMVGFDGYNRTTNEVGTVSFYARGCKEYIPSGKLGEAADFFIAMYGLTEYTDDAKILIAEQDNVMIMFPDNILFDAHKRYNSKSNFYYFYSSCTQP